MSDSLPPPSSPRPPASFNSLPVELLLKIAQHLNQRDAVTFARLSRTAALVAEPIIWEELHITLQGHRRLREEEEDHAESGSAPPVNGEAIVAKVNSILRGANERRQAYIKRVAVAPLPGATYAMVTLLGVVAPNLTHLLFQTPSDGRNVFPLALTDSFDLCLSITRPLFSNLTTLIVGNDALRSTESIPLFCSLCPDVTDMGLSFLQKLHPPWAAGLIPALPKFDRDTKIQRLQLAFGEDEEGAHTDQQLRPFVDLLSHSPQLDQLSVGYGNFDDTTTEDLRAVVDGHTTLKSLYWQVGPSSHGSYGGVAPVGSGVEELMLFMDEWSDMYEPTTIYPKLHTLCLIDVNDPEPSIAPSIRHHTSPSAPSRKFATVGSLLPYFAHHLRSSPHLRHIYTIYAMMNEVTGSRNFWPVLRDQQASGGYTALIRSYRYGTKELLHVRMLVTYTEISDVEISEEEAAHNGGPLTIRYVTSDDKPRERRYSYSPVATWQDFTDYDGMRIPLEVIGAMRRAEGSTWDEWDERIEVSDKAWGVLMKWVNHVNERLAQAQASQGRPTSDEPAAGSG